MGRPKSYDRAEVLERATRLFWAQGYQGTHLSELVEVTGLNRFSLYNEFGGKAGLHRAALEHYAEGLAELGALLEREPLGLANVRAFHRRQLELDFREGCFVMNTIREKNVVPEASREIVQAFAAGVEERLRANLRAAAAAGELPADRDPDALASVLAAFDIGLLSYRSLGASPEVARRLVEEVERLLG